MATWLSWRLSFWPQVWATDGRSGFADHCKKTRLCRIREGSESPSAQDVSSLPARAPRPAAACTGEATAKRRVWRFRREAHVKPLKKGGGTRSVVTREEIAAVLARRPDANAGEITAPYNRGGSGKQWRRVSCIKRALYRAGYVVKKSLRSLEQLQPDFVAKRKGFWRLIRRVDPNRLVLLDESGLNISMTRRHAANSLNARR